MNDAWIQTYTGLCFNPLKPDPEQISIIDIAHALSNICRFTGHVSRFYSVGQHSILVASILPQEYRLDGLLHDAAEAYISDVSKPVKPYLANYKKIEQGIMEAVAYKFGTEATTPAVVKFADLVLLATERRDLMKIHDVPWDCLKGIEPLKEKITPFYPDYVKREFMQTFEGLQCQR